MLCVKSSRRNNKNQYLSGCTREREPIGYIDLSLKRFILRKRLTPNSRGSKSEILEQTLRLESQTGFEVDLNQK